MKTENHKQMTDAVHEYFATYSIGDVLQVLSNVSFDYLKSMLQVGNMENKGEIHQTSTEIVTITNVMTLLGALYHYRSLYLRH